MGKFKTADLTGYINIEYLTKNIELRTGSQPSLGHLPTTCRCKQGGNPPHGWRGNIKSNRRLNGLHKKSELDKIMKLRTYKKTYIHKKGPLCGVVLTDPSTSLGVTIWVLLQALNVRSTY